jgi:ribosomal protein S18 acetylase RimI-like enzyme
MDVRKAKVKEVLAIVMLWKEFVKEHGQLIVSIEQKIKPYIELKKDAHKNFGSYLKKCIYSKNALVLVVVDKEKVVGYSLNLIRMNIPVFKVEKLGYFSDLYIKKEYRRKGFASKFKEETIKWFKSKGIKHASIMVWPQNKFAYKIYKKWGFIDQHLEMRLKL